MFAQAISKHQPRDSHQQREMTIVFLLHVLDAATTRGQHNMDLGEVRLSLLRGESTRGRKLPPQQRAHLRLQLRERNARPDTADQVEPLQVRAMHIGHIGNHRHGFNGQIEFRRSGQQTVAIKTLWCNPNYSHRPGVDPERASDHPRVTIEFGIPRLVAHHRSQGRTDDVIAVGEQPARTCVEPECPEVVAGNKFAHYRARNILRAVAAHDHGAVGETRLYPRQILETQGCSS